MKGVSGGSGGRANRVTSNNGGGGEHTHPPTHPPTHPHQHRRPICHSLLNHLTVYTSLSVVACLTWITCVFHRWMCLVYLRGRTTLDFKFPSLFSLSLASLCQCHVNNDFALVLEAVGVGLLCPPYLEIRTQHVRGVRVPNVLLT